LNVVEAAVLTNPLYLPELVEYTTSPFCGFVIVPEVTATRIVVDGLLSTSESLESNSFNNVAPPPFVSHYTYHVTL
jgi:hypothetical protein